MVKEELIDWKYYTCGANGQIYSYYFKRYLSGRINKYGYIQVKFKCIDGKYRLFMWHRVIWTFFNGTIPEGMQVNHIDENKQNNTLSNLNLMTPKENINWGTRTEKSAAKIRGRILSEEWKRKISENHERKVVVAIKDGKVVMEFASIQEAGRNGFDQSNVSTCCNGKRKTHGGYIWKFKEEYERGILMNDN